MWTQQQVCRLNAILRTVVLSLLTLGLGLGLMRTPIALAESFSSSDTSIYPAIVTTESATVSNPSSSDSSYFDSQNYSESHSESNSESHSELLVAPDLQRILDRGKLIVAVLNQNNSPFFTSKNNRLDGLDIKIAQSIAEQLGVSLEIDRTAQTFDEVVDRVYHFKADLAISKLSRTMKRAQSVRFSRPYVKMRQGLLVNRLQIAQQANGREIVKVIRNLEGKIGVLKGSSYIGFTQQKFPKAVPVEYATWSDLVNAVMRGEIVAAYRDELEIKKIVLGKPEAALQFQTIALTDTQDAIAIATPWSSTHLLAFVNQYLEMTNLDYDADELLQEYTDYFN